MKLVVTKSDETFLKVLCEQGILMELWNYFGFFVPNYKFNPLYKDKLWDGKIRLFNLHTQKIYSGLLPYLEQFCEDRDYEIEFSGERPDGEDEFSLYHAKKFVSLLKIHSDNIEIEAHDYQLDAFIDGMQRRRSLILSPTASGKSYITYLFVRQLLDYQNLKGLVIVPNIGLVEQLASDFKDYSSHNGFDVEANMNRVYDFKGMTKNSDKKIFVSTWQSLQNMPKEYFEQFDYVIGDEAHGFTADKMKYILESLSRAKYRIGLTGSLDGSKTHQLVLEGLFGAANRVITTREMIEQGKSADITIKCIILQHSEEKCKIMYKKPYADEIDYLLSNQARNRFIRNLAISLDKNTLILFERVDKHGKILYNMIKDTENIGNRKVFLIYADVDADARNEIRAIVEKENDAIIIASYKTFSTGVNIKNLHNLIFAHPNKGVIRILQSIGRILRKFGEGKVATLFDISDDMRYNYEMNKTLQHFVDRAKIYTSEKHPFKIYKVRLKDG